MGCYLINFDFKIISFLSSTKNVSFSKENSGNTTKNQKNPRRIQMTTTSYWSKSF
jgi:hypothetical protein